MRPPSTPTIGDARTGDATEGGDLEWLSGLTEAHATR